MTITDEVRAEAQRKLDGFVERFGRITKIYVGQDHCCRCGCRGRYHEGDEITRRNIAHAVRILALGGKCEIDEGCPYVNIPYGDDRAITIYFEGKHDNR